jgi:hypothetical protein
MENKKLLLRLSTKVFGEESTEAATKKEKLNKFQRLSIMSKLIDQELAELKKDDDLIEYAKEAKAAGKKLQGDFGTTEWVDGTTTEKISNNLVKEWFIRHNEDIAQVSQSVTSSGYLKNNLRYENVEE